jgi:peptidoglycan/xylan/chitin deacetylase (PgdA/CDA1 family)
VRAFSRALLLAPLGAALVALLASGSRAEAARHRKTSHRAPHAAHKSGKPKAPRVRTAPSATTAAPKPAAPSQPEVLFTFDDGPALDRTPTVLDLLDKHHIKAVFFVNGWRFQGNKPSDEKAKELLRETLRRGHHVGNHTVHHYFLCGKVYSQRAAAEIEDNATLIEQATGQRPELFRTPYGAHCPPLNAVLAGLGIKPILWDIDPEDWKVKNAAVIEERVTRALKTLRGRAILLLHDVQGETVKALPGILDWIDAENATRAQAGQPQLKVIDYTYLLPERKLVPPLLHDFGRVLIATLRRAPLDMQGVALPLWPAALLAWLPSQV